MKRIPPAMCAWMKEKGYEGYSIRKLEQTLGLPKQTIMRRLFREGWPWEEAVGLLPHTRKPAERMDLPAGLQAYMKRNNIRSMAALAQHKGLHPATIYHRLANGMPWKEAIETAAGNIQPGPENGDADLTTLRIAQGFKSLPAFCEAQQLGKSTVYSRRAAGWTARQAMGLDSPPGVQPSSRYPEDMRQWMADNNLTSMEDVAKRQGISYATIRARLTRKWPWREALGLETHIHGLSTTATVKGK